MTRKLRCLVADDSALSRKIVRTAVESVDGVEVVAVARDGLDAVQRSKQLKPDFVTMDLEMPRMNGIEALHALRQACPDTKVLMVSALTAAGAEITTKALGAGAFDFVLKPVSNNVDECIRTLAKQLAEKVAAVREQLPLKNRLPNKKVEPARPAAPVSAFGGKVRAICIGISTGGPVALSTVVPGLPGNLSVPVFIVQHMPPVFTKSLAEQLSKISKLDVVEARAGMNALPGTVYIAPGGHQMGVEARSMQTRIRITDDPEEANARPSVDYLFRSAAKAFGNQLLVAVLTGMGNDGLVGCRHVKRCGGYVITQDAASCVVYGMPRCVHDAGLSNEVVPLRKMSDALTQFSREGAAL